jgi:NAD(P)-dependent dehydrogenase (short-subunit alcohol dehydrogenase family)
MTGRLEGKRALIYRGGTGLGFACASAMIEAGARVFITGRRVEKLEFARDRLGASRVGLAASDFTRESDVVRVTQAATDFLGAIDTLLVSSGHSTIGTVLGTSPAEFQGLMSTNLLGPFLAVRSAANELLRAAPASIILLASVVATSAMKQRVAYCTSKAGVLGMTRAMALDFAEHNVRVNAISPSLVMTGLALEIFSREANPAAALARRTAQHPLGRLGKPEDIASASVYLASDESAWITGHNLIIDGGLSIA